MGKFDKEGYSTSQQLLMLGQGVPA